jgi:2-oxoglutarate ferredoxin oxidoreductase subunit beta
LNVVVYSGDGNLSAIGGNHLIHAARRNIDLKVICVNNLIYAMTGGQTAPTTPGHATTSTNPYGTFEPAFNLPHLVEAAGAVYVARWTTFHVRQLARSRLFRRKDSHSSKSSRRVRRSISAAIRWATGSTP